MNASYGELEQYLQKSWIGLHTMKNEHFGIGIVEYMVCIFYVYTLTITLIIFNSIKSAGLIAIAHNSGGPKMDIVKGHESTVRGYN
jgi:alpha-1,2-mannosyltransferase